MNSNEENKLESKESHDHSAHSHPHDHHCHRRRFLKIPFIIAAIVLIKSGLVMLLWNSLIPDLFSGPEVTYGQAIGLVVLAKLLIGFGGHRFMGGRFGGPPFGPGRWAALSPEEREKLRESIRHRCSR